MDLQYVSDEHGKTTAVLVPIEEWNRLNSEQKNSEQPKPERKLKPSDFEGSIPPEIADAMQEAIRKSREEWG